MKLLVIFMFLFIHTKESWANTRFNRPVWINTPNGPVRMQTNPLNPRQKDALEGKGVDFFSRAKVKDGVVSVWIRGCNNVVVGDMNEEKDEKILNKLKKIKQGDNIRLKMGRIGSCEVSGWEKN